MQETSTSVSVFEPPPVAAQAAVSYIYYKLTVLPTVNVEDLLNTTIPLSHSDAVDSIVIFVERCFNVLKHLHTISQKLAFFTHHLWVPCGKAPSASSTHRHDDEPELGSSQGRCQWFEYYTSSQFCIARQGQNWCQLPRLYIKFLPLPRHLSRSLSSFSCLSPCLF